MILLGESNSYIEAVASAVTNDLLLKAGNEVTGTQYQIHAFTLAAFKSNAVSKALEVDVYGIVHLSGTILNGYQTGSTIAQLSQSGLHISLIDLGLSLGSL